MPKVSVIVLNWNDAASTIKCIDSLKSQSFKDFEIILVDNGSVDGSPDRLSEISGITLIKNRKNLGFAGGINTGFKRARGKYVALLNNDAVADKNWLSAFVKTMDSNPGIGQLMSKVFDKYGKKEYTFEHYGAVTLLFFIAYSSVPVNDQRKLIPTFGASGGAQIFRRGIALPLPFDDDYFIYHEDNYLSYRFRMKGYQIAFEPASLVYHEGEAVLKKNRQLRPYFAYLAERNRILTVLICYQTSTLVKLIPYIIFAFSLLAIASPKTAWPRLRALLWTATNISVIVKKRRVFQKERKLDDKYITPFMSGKVFEPGLLPSFLRWIIVPINALFITYARLVGLRLLEDDPDYSKNFDERSYRTAP